MYKREAYSNIIGQSIKLYTAMLDVYTL